jgi:hypothetical protein
VLWIFRSAALRSFLISSSPTRRRQSAGSTVAVVEQLERGRSGGMEEGFVESLDEGDELVAGRYAVRLRFAGQGGVGRRVTRLLQRPNLGKVRKDDQREYAGNQCCGSGSESGSGSTMFLGLLDPDPDRDPSIIMQK